MARFRIAGVRARPLQRSTRVLVGPGLAVLIAAVLLLVTIPAIETLEPMALVVQISFCLLGGLAVLRPVTAGVILGLSLTTLLFSPLSFLGLAVVALMVPIAAAATRGHRIWALIFAGWYLCVSVALTARSVKTGSDMMFGVNFWLVFMFLPLLLGEIIRRQRQRAEEQRQLQQEVAERQRRAIARDLHDTLAYATTTMVMRAEQLRLRGNLDDQTLSDLDFIAATGRSASADLRTMLAMLRDPDPEAHSDPDPLGLLPVSRLDEVIAAQVTKLEAFGFDVNMATTGDSTALPERMTTVTARVITETSSNITKHGDPAYEVTVMIDFQGPAMEAIFVNTPHAQQEQKEHRGLGLLGLEEIVAAEGGTLTSGLVGGGWITHLVLPFDGQDPGGS